MPSARKPLGLLAVFLVIRGAAAAPGEQDVSCPTYTIVDNVGLVNGDKLLKQVSAVDVSDCCSACNSTTGCGAFTFNSKDKTCRMTTLENMSSHHVAGVVSGKRSSPSPVPFPDYCKSSSGKKCHNVLYFVADDMRADWGTYGLPVITPNLDALAKKSVLFEHAFCQISVCAPSRMSFMTGRRPDTYQVWNFIDTVPENCSATPGHFRDHGYITLGLGKTFHQDSGAWNAQAYWSLEDKPYYPYGVGKCPHGGQGGGHCMQTDDQIYDYHLRLNTIDYLQYATNKSKATGRPFYVMCGFRKPHAPWQYPQRMWDLYNESAIAIAEHKVLPTGTPLFAWSRQLSVQLENGTGFPYNATSPVPDWVMRDQRHAYYASISYVDEHVGAILETLDASGLQDNTVVLFHADHGYHMGEHGEWEKKSHFDLVVHVPLMIHVPWLPATWGQRCPAMFDLVSVFPTVAALAGLPVPDGVDGVDLSALVANPVADAPPTAFHQYPACGCADGPEVCFHTARIACNNVPRTEFNYMGYSLRNAEWRYTAWFVWNNATLRPDFQGPFIEELYNHTGDHSYEMDMYENVNLAATFPKVAKSLFAELTTFFSEHMAATAHLQPFSRSNTVEKTRADADTVSDPFDT
eukprot:m.402447 g.402447  ORF g.402447 m.402447 type:complete len:633 (-) comp21178_c0_seq8:277-2175(-)